MTDKKAYNNFENENQDTESEEIKLKVKKSSWISHYTPAKIIKKIKSQNSSSGKIVFKNCFKEIKKYFFLDELLKYCDVVNSLVYQFTPNCSLVFNIEDAKNVSQETLEKLTKYTNIVLNGNSNISCSKCLSNSIYPFSCNKCNVFFCIVCIIKHSDHNKREINCIDCKSELISLSNIDKEGILKFYKSEKMTSFMKSFYNCADCFKIIEVSEYLNHMKYKCSALQNKKEFDDSSNLSIQNNDSNLFKEKNIINSINLSPKLISKKSLKKPIKSDSFSENKNSINNAVSIISDLKSINNSQVRVKSKDKENQKAKNLEIEELKLSLNKANEKIHSYERSYEEINNTLQELRNYSSK